jgi:hypothetical protein
VAANPRAEPEAEGRNGAVEFGGGEMRQLTVTISLRLAMSGIELKTAKFFEAADEEGRQLGAHPSEAGSTPGSQSRTTSWETAAAWIGVGAAGLVVICLALIAVPMLTGIKLPKPANVMDWWLWFGGAKSDQTFDKALRDSAAATQREWEEKYKQSPMYQFKGIQPIDLNTMQGMQFNGQSAPHR